MGDIRYIRIIATPAGDAPEWVRQKWIGLELPVLETVPLRMHASGLLTRCATSWMDHVADTFRSILFPSRIVVTGYVAPIDPCVAILERWHPDAANWWFTNMPSLFDTERWWVFNEAACELIPPADARSDAHAG